jgi:formylglycine-generating enzyme required for sulfatase activity
VPIIVTLKDIDEAIEGLNYRNETTFKYKLIHAVRNSYADESSIESLQSIDTEELVRIVWETGDDPELIKNKRKNFSSIKSSVNGDLKKLYSGGKNSQGIIINHNNIFDISDEAKNKALASITDVLREKGIDTSSKLTEILAAVSDILSGAIASANQEEIPEEISRLKNLLGGLSDKFGLPAPGVEDGDKGAASQAVAVIAGETKAGETAADKKLIGDEGITERYEDRTQAEICALLQDKGIDAATRMNGIMDTVKGLLSTALSSAGTQLDEAEADQIKNLMSDLAGKAGLAPPAGAMPQGTDTQTMADTAGEVSGPAAPGETAALIAGILQEAGLDAAGKAGKIMAAMNEMLADAMACAGAGLNAEETGRIKNIFGSFTQNIESAFDTGREAATDDTKMEIVEELEEVLEEAGKEEIVEVIEEVAEDEIPAAAEETTAEGVTEEYLSPEELEKIEFAEADETKKAEEAPSADEVVEIIEEISAGELSAAGTTGEISHPEEKALGTTGADLAGIAAPEEAIASGTLTAEPVTQETAAAAAADYEEIIVADDSVTEIVEELPAEDLAAAVVESIPEETVAAAAGAEEEIFVEETVAEAVEALPEDYIIEETPAESKLETTEGLEVVEEIPGEEAEEIIEELPAAGDGDGIAAGAEKTAGIYDADLQSKAELLEKLAQAAKALEKLGPDLTSSIYSEEEIKEKAKLLSEEFEHYLSVREKFYNQHILIKSGNYLVGAANRRADEFPEQIANLREFYIGKFPVTNALFEIFVEKTGYITTAEKYGFGMVYIPRMQKIKNAQTGTESFSWSSQLQHKKVEGACWYKPSGPQSTLYVKRTHPVVQVSLEDACAFAAWTGKRIPTEKEWEAAARTHHSHIYPWGNNWQENACNLEKSLFGDTTPVDHYLEFANDYEVADTLGNVLEWILDYWKEPKPGEESEGIYTVKGASWISDTPVSLVDRQAVYKNMTSNILGFRCIAI